MSDSQLDRILESIRKDLPRIRSSKFVLPREWLSEKQFEVAP